MQVVMCEAYGGSESLVVKSVPSPTPGPGEVKVRLRARGVSFTDVLRIAGQYHVKTPPPFIPGGEAAGEIVELGADVAGLKVGDRVLCGGGFAEETVQPAASVIKLPVTVSFEAAAAFRSNYTTAYYALQRGRLRPGDTLLVHAASGADVIFDPVGGDVFDESMRSIAPFGRILIVGFTSGRPGVAKTNHLLVKDAEVIGFTIGALGRLDPKWAQRNLEALVGWLGAGRISPYHSHALPLAQAADALKLIIDRKVIGKVLLV
jgi:NADPH2:quinone reductase